jgi:hypothetical protein
MNWNFNCSYMARSSLACLNLSSFWLIVKQQWTIEEISILSNSSHLEWRAGLSDTILKGNHPGTIPARFGLIWFSGFRGEDLNVIWNYWANLNQTLLKWFSGGPLPKLCPVITTSNQDGCQAQNRKRGDEILIVHWCFSVSQNERKNIT